MSDKRLFLTVTPPLQIYGLLSTKPGGFRLALQIQKLSEQFSSYVIHWTPLNTSFHRGIFSHSESMISNLCRGQEVNKFVKQQYILKSCH